MRLLTLVFLSVFCIFCESILAKEMTNIRIGMHPDKTRIVLDLTEEAQYTTLKTGDDTYYELILHNTKSPPKLLKEHKGKGIISAYAFAQGRDNKSLILKIESNKPSQIHQIFAMPRKAKQPYRLVIDIKSSQTKMTKWQKKMEKEVTGKSHVTLPKNKPTAAFNQQPQFQASGLTPLPRMKPVRWVVVIDAGHGGHDPGTICNGHQEKDITLAIAKSLEANLKKAGKYQVVLTRNKDEHVPLRQRFAIAREHQASLLISLHVDSNTDKNVKGLAIYTLSEQASDKEAARLASKENAADFLSDLRFAQATEAEVKNILIDLSQTRTQNLSIQFCDQLMKRFNKDEVLSKNTHRAADFAVLKAPDVASVLIELGYLTNTRDQKRLVDKKYQATIASRIANAIDDYFEHLKT